MSEMGHIIQYFQEAISSWFSALDAWTGVKIVTELQSAGVDLDALITKYKVGFCSNA